MIKHPIQKEEAVRITESFLRGIEKKLLNFFVRVLPVEITPDHLTGIGIVGSFMVALGYYLCSYGYGFLWLASLGFLVNWFGDSLDGSLARFRKIERPIYGFFVDHNVDSISILVIGLGLGLSPFMHMTVALLIIIGYFMLAISTYINSYLRGIFKITYSKIGPTEVRFFAILGNTALFFIHRNPVIRIFSFHVTFFDLLGIFIAILLIFGYFLFFFKDLKAIKKLDPPHPPRKDNKEGNIE
ncbi:MAG: CDP-alcohol phosphatidyltransferase family protein [Bacteroidales bacterium]|nr:CDP-alcohol phosphatidyltransferase family protein [Bacteroidales bacterium]